MTQGFTPGEPLTQLWSVKCEEGTQHSFPFSTADTSAATSTKAALPDFSPEVLSRNTDHLEVESILKDHQLLFLLT